MKFLTNVQQMIFYLKIGIFFFKAKNYHFFQSKKLPFFDKKSVSNFFGSQSGKMKLIFLFYMFFRTRLQKTGDGFFFFFFSKGFGQADIRPLNASSSRNLEKKDQKP